VVGSDSMVVDGRVKGSGNEMVTHQVGWYGSRTRLVTRSTVNQLNHPKLCQLNFSLVLVLINKSVTSQQVLTSGGKILNPANCFS
jgi:hypothetical protein